MTWFHYIAPLLIGIAITSFGVFLEANGVKQFLAGERTNRRRIGIVALCGFCSIFVVAGLLAIGLVLMGPTPIEAGRVSDIVFRSSPSDVETVEIRPFPNQAYPHLVSEPVIVSDPTNIATICEAMSKAKIYSPNHPNSLWSCLLILSINGKPHVCEVHATLNNGVLLEAVCDSDPYSWRTGYGTYRSDQLGAVLKPLAVK